MKKWLTLILWGFFIWAVPTLLTVGLWNSAANRPLIAIDWFNAVGAIGWAVAYAIAACFYFRKSVTKNYVKEAYTAGVVWYLVIIAANIILLDGIYKVPLQASTLFFYLNTIIYNAAIGYIIQAKAGNTVVSTKQVAKKKAIKRAIKKKSS